MSKFTNINLQPNKKEVHHQKMCLTLKDQHDSNVAQRYMWYKKEKCYFGFLYHDRLSLSSTLCGEEPMYLNCKKRENNTSTLSITFSAPSFPQTKTRPLTRKAVHPCGRCASGSRRPSTRAGRLDGRRYQECR